MLYDLVTLTVKELDKILQDDSLTVRVHNKLKAIHDSLEPYANERNLQRIKEGAYGIRLFCGAKNGVGGYALCHRGPDGYLPPQVTLYPRVEDSDDPAGLTLKVVYFALITVLNTAQLGAKTLEINLGSEDALDELLNARCPSDLDEPPETVHPITELAHKINELLDISCEFVDFNYSPSTISDEMGTLFKAFKKD